MSEPTQPLTSFQQEFNRLSFLASIATGSSPVREDQSESSPKTPQNENVISQQIQTQNKIQKVTAQQIQIQNNIQNPIRQKNMQHQIPNSQIINGQLPNGLHLTVKQNQNVNGLGISSSNISNQNNVGQINSLLNLTSTKVRPQTVKVNQRPAIRPRTYTPRGPRVRHIRPALQNSQSPAKITTQNILPNMNQVLFPPSSMVQGKVPIQNYNGKSVSNQQQNKVLVNNIQYATNSNYVATTSSSLNQPIMITNVTGIASNVILSQPNISSPATNNQTYLLPANLAGMSGKVLIVNNPNGKGHQAITLTPSQSAGLQNQNIHQITHQNQLNIQSSNSKIINPVISTPKKDSQSIDQLISQQQNILTQKTNSPNVKPVSLSTFQSIRPKILPTIQPKIIAKQPSMPQGLRLSHFLTPNPVLIQTAQSSMSNRVAISVVEPKLTQTKNYATFATPPQNSAQNNNSSTINSAFAIQTNQNAAQNNNSSSINSAFAIQTNQNASQNNNLNKNMSYSNFSTKSLPTTITVSMPTAFDKTMSQHLQTLQKTDPYLFQTEGNKLQINSLEKQTNSGNQFLSTTPKNTSKSQLASSKNIKASILNVNQNLMGINGYQVGINQQENTAAQYSISSQMTTAAKKQKNKQMKQQQLIQKLQKQQQELQQQQQVSISQKAPQQQNTNQIQQQQLLQQQQVSISQKAPQQQNINQIQQQQLLQQQQQVSITQKAPQQQNINQIQQQQLLQQQQQVSITQKASQKQNITQIQQQQLLQQQQKLLKQQKQQAKQHKQQQELQLKQQQQQMAMNTLIKQQLQQVALQQRQQQIIQQQPQLLTTALQQQLLQQLQNQQKLNIQQSNQQQTVQIPIQQILSSSNNMLEIKQDNNADLLKQLISSNQLQNQQPLKLLSSLTNNLSTQQPIILQLPNNQNILSSQMLQTNQLTSAQLVELKRNLAAMQTSKQLAGNSNVPIVNQASTAHVRIPNKTEAVKQNIIQHRSVFSPSASKQNSTAVTKQLLNKVIKTNNIQSQTQEKLNLGTAVLNKELNNLTPSQRNIILNQLKSGKLGLTSQVSPANLLSTILKNKAALSSANSSSPILSRTINLPSIQTKKILAKQLLPKAIKRPIETIEIKNEHRFAKRWRSRLGDDQAKYLSPNYRTRFTSLDDAVKRLLPYHIVADVEIQKDFDKYDEQFQTYAENFLERKNTIFHKMNCIQFEETQLQLCTADKILCQRILLGDDEEIYKQHKKAISEGRAFVVRNEKKNELECVEIKTAVKLDETRSSNSTTRISLNLSNQQQLDNRLKIAHKDIGNINVDDSDESEEEMDDVDDDITEENNDDVDDITEENNDCVDDITEENNEMAENIDDDNDYIEINDLTEDDMTEDEVNIIDDDTIEMEQVTHDQMYTYIEEDSELAAATNNLLADLQQDDDDFNLSFLL